MDSANPRGYKSLTLIEKRDNIILFDAVGKWDGKRVLLSIIKNLPRDSVDHAAVLSSLTLQKYAYDNEAKLFGNVTMHPALLKSRFKAA